MSDISHITLPDSNTYDIIDASKSGIYTVIGTQTTATVNLTGNIHNISALYDGLTIVYYSPTAIQSNQSWDEVNLNLTLDDGTTTGAIKCWIGDNSSGRYVTSADGLSSKHTLVMTYWSSATWGSSNSDKWVILSGDELTKITRSTFGGSTEWPIPLVSFNTLNTNYSFERVYVPHPNNNIPLKFNPLTGNLVTTKLNGTPVSDYTINQTPPAEYDDTSTYALGDFVTYNDNIYICISTISTAEAWNSAHWQLVNADDSYLHSLNPKGSGSFSLNRKAGTTIGAYSVAEGYNCTASGIYSHAEGDTAIAGGGASHAEGYHTTASSSYAHAEGYTTTASGSYSHAEGYCPTSSGSYSHAEGYFTTANHAAQHVFGAYNVADPSTANAGNRGNYVEIVGNGTSNNDRSNARTLDWSGNEVLAGGLKINSTQDVATQVSLTQAEYDALVSAGTVDLVNTIYFITDGNANACSAAEVTYSNTVSGLSATNVQSAIDEVVSKKMDKIPTGTHTVHGIWTDTYYSTCRFWVPFPNADKYTITLSLAKYRSANTTMTDVTTPSIIVKNDCGFLVSCAMDNIANRYGYITFTTA